MAHFEAGLICLCACVYVCCSCCNDAVLQRIFSLSQATSIMNAKDYAKCTYKHALHTYVFMCCCFNIRAVARTTVGIATTVAV